MASAKDQMRMLQGELDRVRAEIDRLKVEEALLVKMLGKMGDQSVKKARRQRAPAVKPVVLDVMKDAGINGATTSEVDERVRTVVPTVAKDTVGSILSRLKGDGALTYVGERYYEKGKEPKAEDPRMAAGRMMQ